MSLTVGDLTPQHIGRTVTIDGSGARVTGQLRTVRAETDWVPAQRLCAQEPDLIPGLRTVTLAVGLWTTGQLPLTTPVYVAP